MTGAATAPPIKIALAGVGKIARDQHLPALTANSAFELVATADPVSRIKAYPGYSDLDLLLDGVEVDAIAICTPPQARFAIALRALHAGKHILLEKPPCASVAEVHGLAEAAARSGSSIYTAWHSQHAPGISLAREWVRNRPIDETTVNWRENVREWHPGQDWIWRQGGFGVFDPGINALSMISTIFAPCLSVTRSRLWIPSNCQTPIAAELEGTIGDCGTFRGEFDFRQTSLPTWNIDIRSREDRLTLSEGGAKVLINGIDCAIGPGDEYASTANSSA